MPEKTLLRGDPSSGTCRLDPPDGMAVSTAVFVALGELSETPSTEIDPLSRSVDPDLIDALHSARTDDAITIEGEVSVQVEEYTVVIEDGGEVLIRTDH